MSEMVERVAEALCGCKLPDAGFMRDLYEAQARATIEALREPTEAMTKAGDLPGWDDIVSIGLSAEVWAAMIDAALANNAREDEI